MSMNVSDIMRETEAATEVTMTGTVRTIAYIRRIETPTITVSTNRWLKYAAVGAFVTPVCVLTGGAAVPAVVAAAAGGGIVGALTGLGLDILDNVCANILALLETIETLSLEMQKTRIQEHFQQNRINCMVMMASMSLCSMTRSLNKLVRHGLLESEIADLLTANLSRLYNQICQRMGPSIVAILGYTFEGFQKSVLELDGKLRDPREKAKKAAIARFFNNIDDPVVERWVAVLKGTEQNVEEYRGRVVYAESIGAREFYTVVYRTLKNWYGNDRPNNDPFYRQLGFRTISDSDKNGSSSEHVAVIKRIVNDNLDESGFLMSFGILARDAKRSFDILSRDEKRFSSSMLVLKRYSIENFFLDPIILCSAMRCHQIDRRIHIKLFMSITDSDVEGKFTSQFLRIFSKIERILEKSDFSTDELQKSIDWYFLLVLPILAMNIFYDENNGYKENSENREICVSILKSLNLISPSTTWDDLTPASWESVERKFIEKFSKKKNSLETYLSQSSIDRYELKEIKFMGINYNRITYSENHLLEFSLTYPKFFFEIGMTELVKSILGFNLGEEILSVIRGCDRIRYIPEDLQKTFKKLDKRVRQNVSQVQKLPYKEFIISTRYNAFFGEIDGFNYSRRYLSRDISRGKLYFFKEKLEGLRAYPTKGDGDCALHAVLGQWNPKNKQFECADVAGVRRKIRLEIVNSDISEELRKLIQDGIRDWIISDSDLENYPQSRLLRRDYHEVVSRQELLQPECWQQFEMELNKYESIRDYILIHHTEKNPDASFKDKFYSALALEGTRENELRGLIASIDELEKEFNRYNEKLNAGYSWEENILPEVKAEFSAFVGALHGWLAPQELNIIAHIFEKTIHYYPTFRAKMEEFNPGRSSPVVIRFNGANHFERCLPTPPEGYKQSSNSEQNELLDKKLEKEEDTAMEQVAPGSVALIVANGFFARAENKRDSEKDMKTAYSFFQKAKDTYEIALKQPLNMNEKKQAEEKLEQAEKNLGKLFMRRYSYW